MVSKINMYDIIRFLTEYADYHKYPVFDLFYKLMVFHWREILYEKIVLLPFVTT